MKNGHKAACEAIERMLELLDSDQTFKLTLTGLDDGKSEELMLFFADSLGTFYSALEEMRSNHARELEYEALEEERRAD